MGFGEKYSKYFDKIELNYEKLNVEISSIVNNFNGLIGVSLKWCTQILNQTVGPISGICDPRWSRGTGLNSLVNNSVLLLFYQDDPYREGYSEIINQVEGEWI